MATIHHERASAKLTRTLHITGRRRDGYHFISSEMISLDLADELVIDEGGSGISVVDAIAWTDVSGERPRLDVAEDESNLVQRALNAIGRQAGVRLVKRIPAGAGLGGGSSDAAAVLRCFGVDDYSLAASLGADVPFCIAGGRALVSGIGEVIEPLEDEAIHVIVVTPRFSVSTRAVYDAYDEIASTSTGGPNDLEPAALVVEPRLRLVKDVVASVTGREAVLAGSGASYFVECTQDEQEGLRASLESALGAEIGPVVVSPCRSTRRRPA